MAARLDAKEVDVSTRAVQSSGAVTPSSSSRLLEAEVNRLIRTISPYGVLRKDTLARACGARAWRPGRFVRIPASAGGPARHTPPDAGER